MIYDVPRHNWHNTKIYYAISDQIKFIIVIIIIIIIIIIVVVINIIVIIMWFIVSNGLYFKFDSLKKIYGSP